MSQSAVSRTVRALRAEDALPGCSPGRRELLRERLRRRLKQISRSIPLVVWVGGDKAIYERHAALLRKFADKPHHVGPIGAGTVAKVTTWRAT